MDTTTALKSMDAHSVTLEARDNLSWRIKEGKHRNGIYELLEIELDDPKTARPLMAALTNLLLDDDGDKYAQADLITDGLIKRYLDRHPELVSEEVAEILAEEE